MKVRTTQGARETDAPETVHIALLRAVNLGGGSTVRMEDLRRWVAGCGFRDVRTWIQSGNVVFRGPRSPAAETEHRFEEAIEHAAGYRTSVFVRTAEEWSSVLAENPFPREAVRDPGRLTVLVLKGSPAPSSWAALRDAIVGRETVRDAGRIGYVYYPDGQGRSRLTTSVIERALGTPGTIRNWNTVTKLAEMSQDS
jgi:uncharacterized protein (DUF1697 family)